MGNQIISGPVAGPILSNGAAITVTAKGSIAGGPDGVDALAFSITKLTNDGSIVGGVGPIGGSGGLGVLNDQTIATLANMGVIRGGEGGAGALNGGAGGAAISNAGVILSIDNLASATIAGGAGAKGAGQIGKGGAGGAGVSTSAKSMIGSLNNLASATISVALGALAQSRTASAAQVALVCRTRARSRR